VHLLTSETDACHLRFRKRLYRLQQLLAQPPSVHPVLACCGLMPVPAVAHFKVPLARLYAANSQPVTYICKNNENDRTFFIVQFDLVQD
jgi:hypothetical protein